MTKTVIGRGAALMERFADDLSRSFGGPPMGKAKRTRLNRHRVGKLHKRPAGGSFAVLLMDDEGKATGYIARVTVTYEGFDADAANAR